MNVASVKVKMSRRTTNRFDWKQREMLDDWDDSISRETKAKVICSLIARVIWLPRRDLSGWMDMSYLSVIQFTQLIRRRARVAFASMRSATYLRWQSILPPVSEIQFVHCLQPRRCMRETTSRRNRRSLGEWKTTLNICKRQCESVFKFIDELVRADELNYLTPNMHLGVWLLRIALSTNYCKEQHRIDLLRTTLSFSRAVDVVIYVCISCRNSHSACTRVHWTTAYVRWVVSPLNYYSAICGLLSIQSVRATLKICWVAQRDRERERV